MPRFPDATSPPAVTRTVPETPAASETKRVLVISYSQTGQLDAITRRILEPLQDDSRFAVHVEPLRPRQAFPFPWSVLQFFDAFPESARLTPGELQPLTLQGDEDFDLVILPWQVWYLAPSQPVTAFLKHPLAQQLLAGKPVVSVIACRNMWMLALDKLRGLLAANGARLIDNVVLTDRAPTLATLITTPMWLLTGRRDAVPGLPAAGIATHDIARCRRFGLALRDALLEHRERGTAPLLTGLEAAVANPRLLFSERAGTRSFAVWGRLLQGAGAPGAALRRPLLILYMLFLIAIILTVVPVSLALQALLRPLLAQRLAGIKTHFEQPSGSGTERLSRYDV